MATLNRVQLIGNLGQDFELRHTLTAGVACGSVSIAMTEKYKGTDGELKEHTEWIRVTLFGRLAATIGKYLTKGRLILVEGSLRTRDYETAEGEQRRITEVRARNIQLLDRPPQREGDEPGADGAGDDAALADLTPPADVTEIPIEDVAAAPVDPEGVDEPEAAAVGGY